MTALVIALQLLNALGVSVFADCRQLVVARGSACVRRDGVLTARAIDAHVGGGEPVTESVPAFSMLVFSAIVASTNVT